MKVLWAGLPALFLYLYFVLRALRGLSRVSRISRPVNKTLRAYSIIIAAHNEAHRIGKLMEALTRLRYPEDRYEVIVSADRCTDDTVEIVRAFRSRIPRLKIIEVWDTPPGVSPKKHALHQAIQAAEHSHLLFLDADVLPHPTHIQAFNGYFDDDTAAVVSIRKPSVGNAWWERFLSFERLVSWCIAAAGVGLEKPFLSFGGNWGYTREAFEAVGGFEKIKYSLSGDDDLLLQQMSAGGLKVNFCLDPGGWVSMEPPTSLGHFFRQRRRHFSAGKYYRRTLKLGYALFHAGNLVLWIMGLTFWTAFPLLLIKLAADAAFVYRGGKLFHERFSPLSLVGFDFLYMLYNTLVGPLGFVGKIRW